MFQQSAFKIAAPDYRNTVVYPDGYNENIITTLNESFPRAVEQCKDAHFSGTNATEKARAIYNYLRTVVKYEKDPEGRQMIQLPGRLLNDRKRGDCKSLSLAAAAFMYCAGIPNVRLRYAGYKKGSTTPTHVYAVGTDEKGRDIIVDAVYKQFNKEVPYEYKKDAQMKISVLSGTPARVVARTIPVTSKKISYPARLAKLRGRVRPGGLLYTVISNELARVSGGPFLAINYGTPQLEKYRRMIQVKSAAAKAPFLKSILEKEAAALASGKFAGAIYTPRTGPEIAGIEEEIGRLSLKKLKKSLKKISPKAIFRGVKKVGLVAPRKAFLILVRLNVRGIATRLLRLPADRLKTTWVNRFGGTLSVIQSAIKAGAKKRPLFGSGKRVKSISGIGVVIDDSENIGDLASVATVITAAAPVLIAFVKQLGAAGIAPVPENAGEPAENGNFSDAEGAAAEDRPGLSNWINKAQEIARETGIIPDKPATAAENIVNEIAPGDDLAQDPTSATRGRGGLGFNIGPGLLIGGVALAYLATNKK